MCVYAFRFANHEEMLAYPLMSVAGDKTRSAPRSAAAEKAIRITLTVIAILIEFCRHVHTLH